MPAPKGHPPYNKNGEGGRPKKYTPEFVNDLAKHLEYWINLDKNNIFIEAWCLENDIPEETVTVELIKNERFSNAYKKLKSKQKLALFEGSLKRKFAHPMCALILSHNHGVYQKTEQKISGSADDPLAFVIQEVDGETKDLVIE